jgi:trimeric autotransporter adhesin
MSNTVQEQIVREASDIEKAKVGLMSSAKAQVDAANAAAAQGRYLTPDYKVQGMTRDQLDAIQLGRQGIGAYQPYMNAAAQGTAAGASTLGEAANVLRGADTRAQFGAAQAAMNNAALPINQMTAAANLTSQGVPLIQQGAQGMANAQNLALASTNQPGFQQGIGSLYGAAEAARTAARLGPAPTAQAAQFQGPANVNAQNVNAQGIQAAQTGYNPSLQAFQMGPAERLQTQSITAPGSAQQYMSPYQQAVTDIGVREAQRQDDIARQGRNAAAVKSGAFGGSRQAIMESEAARNLSQLKADIQNKGSQEAYMAGQQQFNAEQQARLAAQQANQQAGLTVGQQNLASLQNTQQLGTQTGLQTSLANLSSQQQANVQNAANALQAQGMNQSAAMQAALANQQVGYNTNMQNAQMQQQANLANQALQGQYGLSGAQFGLQAAQQQAAAGTGQIGAAAQQAGIQQNAANMYGNLAGQQANLAGMYGTLGAQQAGILGQQSQLNQSLGQGIGSLASQQFGVGQSMAQGLGSLGTQQSNLAMQQAALGQNAQALGQQDTNFLFNLGSAQQRQQQSEVDAARQNELTKNMQPYQQMGYLSDIYKGAPSSQMAVTTQSQATPSPFMQAAGLGIAGVSAAAAANRSGII